MLSDEEEEAIEILKKLQKTKPYIIWGDGETPYNKSNMVSTILELIEKQSKEIEELKKYQKYYEEMEEVNKNFIRVDKIKAKIEVMNTNIINAKKFDCDYIGQCRFAKYVLQSLLEKE